MDGQIIDNTLAWLLEKYLENPNAIWDISEVAGKDLDMQQLHELGRYLAKKGFVKNHEVFEDGFTCTITTLGMSRVSDGLVDVKYKILHASIQEKKKSIMEILNISPEHYQRVHDYATYLKKLGIIECIFFSHDVYAEPTYFGREWYEANRVRLVN
jgi:hypothetical protein